MDRWLSDDELTAGVARALADYKAPKFHYTLTMPLTNITAHHICKNIGQAKARDRKLGMFGAILNTDQRVGGGGLHWVSVLVDTRWHTIEYFDPMGGLPSTAMWQLLSDLNQKLRASNVLARPADFLVSQGRFQGDAHNCGIFAIWFFDLRAGAKIPFAYVSDFAKEVDTEAKLRELRDRWIVRAS